MHDSTLFDLANPCNHRSHRVLFIQGDCAVVEVGVVGDSKEKFCAGSDFGLETGDEVDRNKVAVIEVVSQMESNKE